MNGSAPATREAALPAALHFHAFGEVAAKMRFSRLASNRTATSPKRVRWALAIARFRAGSGQRPVSHETPRLKITPPATARRRRGRRSNRHARRARPASRPRRKTHSARSARSSSVVERGDVGEAAAEHDDVGIDDVDDRRQPARQAGPIERRDRRRPRRRRPRAAAAIVCGVAREPVARRIRARAPGRTERSRCSRSGRNSRVAPAFAVAAPGQRIMAPFAGDAVAARTSLPSTTRPPPTPVPRMTPKTTRAPAPAPSAASDSAKQLASFSIRTGRPRRSRKSRSSGRPLSTVSWRS